MKFKREVTSLVMALIGLPAIYFGGIFFFLVFAFILCVAAWEFGRLFRPLDIRASDILLVGGTLIVLAVRAFIPQLAVTTLSIFILLAMTYHLVSFEMGREKAGIDFAITLTGVAYLGWIGAYFIDLRALPDGFAWFLLCLAPVWLADSAAYYIGSRFGRHKMSPRLSPKKSWEGYIASILGGGLGGLLLGFLFNMIGLLDVSLYHAFVIGLLAGALPTLGDLGESMIKRQAGMKDSGTLIPGHGGAFDRIDSWLWAVTIGFFYISLVIL